MRSSVMMPLPWAAGVLAPRRFGLRAWRDERPRSRIYRHARRAVMTGLSRHPGFCTLSRRQLHALVPVLLEAVAQYLAAIALRQVRHDHDVLRHLRGRQGRPAVLDHGRFGEACPRPRHHEAHDLLAIDRVGHADCGGIEDAGVLEQYSVDLQWSDIPAA